MIAVVLFTYDPSINLGTVLHATAIIGLVYFVYRKTMSRLSGIEKKQDALLSNLPIPRNEVRLDGNAG